MENEAKQPYVRLIRAGHQGTFIGRNSRSAGYPITLWLLLGLLILGSVAKAQPWTIGVRVGMNASRMGFQDKAARELVKPTPGFHVGVYTGYQLSHRLELRTEILYSTKGFDSDDEMLKLGYVEVPVLLALRHEGPVTPRVFAGPVLSFETQCRSMRVPGLGDVSCDDPLESLDRKKLDAGLALGAGIGVFNGPGKLFLDAWINSGLININNESRPPGWVRNQALHVSLAYQHQLGGES